MKTIGRTCIALSMVSVFAAAFAPQSQGASVVVTVDGASGPWLWQSSGLNAAFQYGDNNQLAPAVVSASDGIDFTPGNVLDIEYVSGLVYEGGGWPLNDADGALWYGPVNDATNSDGTPSFPSFYFDPADYPAYSAALAGAFADDSGAVVGTPFKIGNSRYVIIPAGATRLQLGDNDTQFGDNSGSWLIKVDLVGTDDSLPPHIVSFGPTNQAVAYGGSATVFVGAIGASPLNYQWFSNGVAVVDATNRSFTATNLGYGMISWDVVVSNAYGAVTSSVATAGVPVPWNGIVWNGDFETPHIGTGGSPITSFSPDGVWTGESSGIFTAGAFDGESPHSGWQAAWLSGTGAYMSQLITVPSNGVYRLSFWDAGRPSYPDGGDTTYQVLLDASVIAQGSTYSGMPFTSEVFQFTANAGQHSLKCELTSGATAYFDVVSIDYAGPEPLHFDPPEPTTNGFRLHLTGLTGHGPAVVYASSDLVSWTPIYTNAPAIGLFDFLDSDATNFPARFYRAVEQ